MSYSSDSEGKSVKILRDTGSVQSLILKELLPSLSNYVGVDLSVYDASAFPYMTCT